MQTTQRQVAPTDPFILHAGNRAALAKMSRPIPQHPLEDLAALQSLAPVLFLSVGAAVCSHFILRDYGTLGVAGTVAFCVALLAGLVIGINKGLRKRVRRERLFARGEFLPGRVVRSSVSAVYSQPCWEATPEVIGRLLTVQYRFVTPAGREIVGTGQGDMSEQPLPGTSVIVVYLGEDDYELL